MFVNAVADQSLVIQGYLHSVACTKSFLHYIFSPDQGLYNFIKKLVKVKLSLCFVSDMSYLGKVVSLQNNCGDFPLAT